jgi:hypothetical protein
MSSAHPIMRGLLDSRRERYSLPQKFYGDTAFYDLDLDLLFGRCWILAGFECQIGAPGRNRNRRENAENSSDFKFRFARIPPKAPPLKGGCCWTLSDAIGIHF